MKVYIVTNGDYSDYMIEKVFSNREAAEEYKKWHNIRNEIEEYEVHDQPFDELDGDKVMFIRVQGKVYPEAVVDIRYEIRRELINATRDKRSGRGLLGYHKPGVFDVYNYHFVPVDQWDEDKYKAKYTKALYDLAGIAKAMFAEGASVQDVERALWDQEDEE